MLHDSPNDRAASNRKAGRASQPMPVTLHFCVNISNSSQRHLADARAWDSCNSGAAPKPSVALCPRQGTRVPGARFLQNPRHRLHASAHLHAVLGAWPLNMDGVRASLGSPRL